MQTKTHHKVYLVGKTLVAAGAAYINLLNAIEDPATENVTTDIIGTDTGPAQCEKGSRLLGGSYLLTITGQSDNGIVEVLMYKDKRDDLSDTTVPSDLFTETVTPEIMALRKYAGKYYLFQNPNANSAMHQVRIKIPKKLLGPMHEDDKLKLIIKNTSGANTITYSLVGKSVSAI